MSQLTVTQEQHDALEKIAEAAASDIKGDHPDMDTNYDMWVETFMNGAVTVGVIDMGDTWQSVYVWDNGSWEQDTSVDPHVMIDRIILQRSTSGF